MTDQYSHIMFNSWVHRFLGLADHIATWSKDPSTKVGAVVVQPTTKIVMGLGFNGFPRGVQDYDDRLNDREVKYKLVVHAEMNAVLNANANTRGCYLFTSLPPCHDCTKFLIQAGISRIYTYSDIPERWLASFEMSKIMLREAEVPIYLWDKHTAQVTHIYG